MSFVEIERLFSCINVPITCQIKTWKTLVVGRVVVRVGRWNSNVPNWTPNCVNSNSTLDFFMQQYNIIHYLFYIQYNILYNFPLYLFLKYPTLHHLPCSLPSKKLIVALFSSHDVPSNPVWSSSIPQFTLSFLSFYYIFYSLPISIPKLPSIISLSVSLYFPSSRSRTILSCVLPAQKLLSTDFFKHFFPFLHSCFLDFLPPICQFILFGLFFLIVLRRHSFHSCNVHQLSNSKFPSCLFLCFSFSNFSRYFPFSPNFRTISHHSAFSSKCSLPRIPLSVSSSAFLIFVSSLFSSECPIPADLVSRRCFFWLSFSWT